MAAQILTIDHLDLSVQPLTYISTDYSSGTSLVVKNTSDFSANDYLVLGKLGSEQTEIVQISSITNKTTIVLFAGGNFSHAADTTVVKIPYNQIKIYRSTTGVGGSYSVLTTIGIQVDRSRNTYYDSTGTTSYSYKISYYNSSSAVESLSGEFTSATLPDWSLQTMQDNILKLFGDTEQQFIDRDMITVWLNELYTKLQYQLAGGETPRFINSVNINASTTATSPQVYDLSSYNMLSIFMIELSTDGGTNFLETITPKDFRLKDDPGSITHYDYRIEGDNLQISPALSGGSVMRIWYTTNPTPLSNPTDLLANPFRVMTETFINYGLRRAHEKDRRMSELATYYATLVKNDISDRDGIFQKLKKRIHQGNMMIATTFSDDYSGY